MIYTDLLSLAVHPGLCVFLCIVARVGVFHILVSSVRVVYIV